MHEPALAEYLQGAEVTRPCVRCALRRTRLTVNGVSFDVLDSNRFLSTLREFADCGHSHVVHFLAAHPTVVAREVPAYHALLESSDLVVPDGAPIALAMWLRNRSARRLTSTDAFQRVCADGLRFDLRHYFVGGASTEVAEALRENLNISFFGINVVGFSVPPFRPYDSDELAALVASIRASRADIVWVGLGAPKQEVLSHRLRAAEAAPAIVTIGATFDFVAETKPRAPKLLRLLGLEWLFRVALEPRRLWRRYLLGNLQFLAGMLSEAVRKRPRQGEVLIQDGASPFRSPTKKE